VSDVSEYIQLSKIVKKHFKEERRRLRKIKKERLEARRTKKKLDMVAAVHSQVTINETANSTKVSRTAAWISLRLKSVIGAFFRQFERDGYQK
jgi:hypothetical protein